MTFRLNSCKIFCTYKSHISIEDIKKRFDIVFKKNRDYKMKIAHETADSETPYNHTHILIKLNKRKDIKNQNMLDINNIHGDYKPTNTKQHFINRFNYLDKENCIYNDIILKESNLKTNQWDEMIPIIQKCKSWTELINTKELQNKSIARCLNYVRELYWNKPKPKLFNHKELRNYQKIWIDKLLNQNDRQILWIWDEFGNSGKSTVCNWLLDNKSCYFVDGGKYADILYGYDNEDIIIFDLPKSSEDFCPYKAMEIFKNGRGFSSKYTSGMKVFGPKKVIVMSNYEPDTETLIKDRWEIIKVISKNKNIKKPEIQVMDLTNENQINKYADFVSKIHRASFNTIRRCPKNEENDYEIIHPNNTLFSESELKHYSASQLDYREKLDKSPYTSLEKS